MTKQKKLNYIILSLPFLDVITSLLTRYYNLFLTPGLVVKGILLLLTIIYILFINKSKYKKISSIFIYCLLGYFFLYFLSKPEIINKSFVFDEITYLFKLFYFPIMYLGFLCFFDESKLKKEDIKKTLFNSLLIYTGLLLIPLILGNANNTYHYGLKGTIGWFYSGNEISNIVVILFASIFFLVEQKTSFKLFLMLPMLFLINNIGTKVAYFGLLVVGGLLLISGLILNIKTNKKNVLKYIALFIVILLFSTKSVTLENNKYLFEHQISMEEITNPILIDKENLAKVNEIQAILSTFYDKNKFNLFVQKVLNNRNVYLANTISIYNNNNYKNKLLYGIGFSNTKEIKNKNIVKLIEMDVLDGFFHYGLVGLIIMTWPFIFTLYLIIKTKSKPTIRSLYYLFIILMMGGISVFSGHVLTSPSVVLYITLYLMLLLMEFKVEKS